MENISFIVVYISIWWVIFYITLPFGIVLPKEPDKGHASSAPKNPKLFLKILITSFLALIFSWLVIYLLNNNFFAVIYE